MIQKNYRDLYYPGENDMNLAIFGKYEQHVVNAGTVIFREKDPGDFMYIIVNGRVSISKHVIEGVDKTLNFLEEGEYFGEMSLLLNAARSATATAVEETTLIRLTRDDLKHILREYPAAGMTMLIQLATRLEKANKEAILLALELALIEQGPQPASAISSPGKQLIIATGSFEMKHLKEVLRCRKDVYWTPQTTILASLLKPGQSQNALIYILQTQDIRETLKLATCFKHFVQWEISLAVSTDDDVLDTFVYAYPPTDAIR